jgi:hypothetical protein
MIKNRSYDSEGFNRTAKIFLDSGEVASPEEAVLRLQSFGVIVIAGQEVARSRTLQAALLTIVNAGVRSFLGGVYVSLPSEEIRSQIPGFEFDDLATVIRRFGGRIGQPKNEDKLPILLLGDAPLPLRCPGRALQLTFDRWTAGVTPAARKIRLAERDGCALAGILAGAFGLSEVFQSLRGRNSMAMRRAFAVSLWEPDAPIDWHARRNEPIMDVVPDRFWLIGLGNLGQAYLWTIGFLGYSAPKNVHLTLQDFDILSKANISTSLLTNARNIGIAKTRAMAAWAERRGYHTNIIERRFPGRLQLDNGDPHLALCGLDNASSRQKLEDIGFELILEAGLGTGERYLNIDQHVFPGTRTAQDIWRNVAVQSNAEELVKRPGYRAIAARGVDDCGLLQLANRAVGVPFVGVVAATLAIAAACRHVLSGVRVHQISLNLSTPEDRQIFFDRAERPVFNPGFQKAIA